MNKYRLTPRRSQATHAAFTLIELTIALLLSSMMVVAVMGLTSRLAKSNQLMREKYPSKAWVNAFRQRLQKDYEGCRSLQVDLNRIKLRTFIIPQSTVTSVARSAEITHLPVEVIYSIQKTEQSTFVTRDERILSSSIPESRAREVLAFGPASFVALDRLDTDVAPPSVEIQVRDFHGDELLKTALIRYAGARRQ